MKKWVKKLIKKDDGQVLVLFALLLVALVGFVALVVDIGVAYSQKASLQNTADAAALAGAQDLPTESMAINTAINYAGQNGLKAVENGVAKEGDTVTVTPKYKGDPNKLQVEVERKVPTGFAGALGFKEFKVVARAVAKRNPKWAGEALPFLNLDDDYKTNPKIEIWEKTGPGDFESMWPDDYEIVNGDDPSKTYFVVDYEDGITITKGVVATIKQEIGYVFDQCNPKDAEGNPLKDEKGNVITKPIYVFTLSSEVIKSGKYNTAKINNKDVIPLEDLVLIKASFDAYDESAKKLDLTYIEEYDINKGVYPTKDLDGNAIGTSKLVE